MISSNPDVQHQLQMLDAQIAARVQSIRAEQDWFPCRRGCDQCCRQLAHPPELSKAEWARVDAAVAQLPASVQMEIERNIQALLAQMVEGQGDAPIICPYLDRTEGACFIYGDRPIACRTYGFFVGRDHDQYCQQIEMEVTLRGGAGIVWGNGDAIRREVERIGGVPIPFAVHYFWLRTNPE